MEADMHSAVRYQMQAEGQLQQCFSIGSYWVRSRGDQTGMSEGVVLKILLQMLHCSRASRQTLLLWQEAVDALAVAATSHHNKEQHLSWFACICYCGGHPRL